MQTDPPPAKLVVSALFSRMDLEAHAIRTLENEFGPVELVSERIPFVHTRYYEKEMGPELERRILSFRKLIRPDGLVEAKLRAHAIEDRYRSAKGQRGMNLDPGLLGLHNFVLATHKGYAHRIYLGRGIRADLTLIYAKGRFRPLEWTYPDYASSQILDLMGIIRALFLRQLRDGQGAEGHAS